MIDVQIVLQTITYGVLVLSASALLHSYIAYPLMLWVLSAFASRRYRVDERLTPRLSIVIAAYNEEYHIETTLRTLLASDYPTEHIEILVGSDCSSDSTNTILETLAVEFPRNIRPFLFQTRRGKSAILNDIAAAATGELLVFCDANTLYDEQALKRLAMHFADERVGGVCGRLIYKPLGEAVRDGSREQMYWEYEAFIRQMEGRLGRLIGGIGAIYAIRRPLYTQMPANTAITDDFFIVLKVIEQGFDVTYYPAAFAFEDVAPNAQAEFHRRIRICANTLNTMRWLTGFFRVGAGHGLTAFCLFSHKILRWLTPVWLALAFVSCGIGALLSGVWQAVFVWLFALQSAVYAAALAGLVLARFKARWNPFAPAYYFVLTAAALAVGIGKFLTNQSSATWQATERR